MIRKAALGMILMLLSTSMLAFAFSIPQAKCSGASIIGWSQTYGGTDDDEAYSVVQTSDGGYAVAGRTLSFGAGYYDAWLVKTNASGNMEWNKTYGRGGGDEPYSVQQTNDGGYIIAGYTTSFGAGNDDFWLIKIDSSGNHQWNKTYGGTESDYAHSVQQTNDGGYIIAGYTFSFGAGDADAWLVKTNASGNMMWNKTYGGTHWDIARSVRQTSDGGYIIAGTTCSLDIGGDFWLVKADSSGSMEWNKTYGGAGSDWAFSVQQTNDGGYIIAGFTGSFGAGGDFWLVKTNAYGVMQWNKTYGGTESDYAYSVRQTSDGGYIIAGATYSFGAGGRDFWLVKADSSGNMQWNQTYGGTSDDYAYSVVQTTDGGYALAGYTESFGAGGSDFWLVKTDEFGVIPEFPSAIILPLFMIISLISVVFIKLGKKKQ